MASEQDVLRHPHDGYAYDGCRCVCCTNVRALAERGYHVTRAALIDELVAAVEKEPGLTVTEFYNEPDRIDRAAVLRLLEGARHGK